MPASTHPSPDLSRLVDKLDSISRLDANDRVQIEQLPSRTRSIEAGADIIAEGDEVHECCLVLEGLVGRYNMVRDGERQSHSFHVAGDLPDRDSLHVQTMDHSIVALSAARVAFIPHVAVLALIERRPNVAVAFWRDAIVEGAIYRQWLVNVGRRNAKQRLAHLTCEMFVKMDAVGLAEKDHFFFPVMQAQLADATGLTPVHINRTLRALRQAGLLHWKGAIVTIPNLGLLEAFADFDPKYLHLKRPPPEPLAVKPC
jgi:CRP-like cAMP-binding protein